MSGDSIQLVVSVEPLSRVFDIYSRFCSPVEIDVLGARESPPTENMGAWTKSTVIFYRRMPKSYDKDAKLPSAGFLSPQLARFRGRPLQPCRPFIFSTNSRISIDD